MIVPNVIYKHDLIVIIVFEVFSTLQYYCHVGTHNVYNKTKFKCRILEINIKY